MGCVRVARTAEESFSQFQKLFQQSLSAEQRQHLNFNSPAYPAAVLFLSAGKCRDLQIDKERLIREVGTTEELFDRTVLQITELLPQLKPPEVVRKDAKAALSNGKHVYKLPAEKSTNAAEATATPPPARGKKRPLDTNETASAVAAPADHGPGTTASPQACAPFEPTPPLRSRLSIFRELCMGDSPASAALSPAQATAPPSPLPTTLDLSGMSPAPPSLMSPPPPKKLRQTTLWSPKV